MGLTWTESKWSLLIIWISMTNIVRVRIPATTCLKSKPIFWFGIKNLKREREKKSWTNETKKKKEKLKIEREKWRWERKEESV